MSRFVFCLLLIGIPYSACPVAAQDQTESLRKGQLDDKFENTIGLAKDVIRQFELRVSDEQREPDRSAIVKMKRLVERLDEIPAANQAIVLQAIHHLVKDAAADVCVRTAEKFESNEVTEVEWAMNLYVVANLLPPFMDDFFIKQLEIWESKYPYESRKVSPKTMFNPRIVNRMSLALQKRARESSRPMIRATALSVLNQKDDDNWKSLNASAIENLQSADPWRRVAGVRLLSRLNPRWNGHQALLKKLSDDSNPAVSSAASEMWLKDHHGSNNSYRFLEAFKRGTDREKMVALNNLTPSIVKQWGSLKPITDLVVSESGNLRTIAIRCLTRIKPGEYQPLIRVIQNSSDLIERQVAISHLAAQGWILNSIRRWERNPSTDRVFAILSKAERDGLETLSAMQKLTRPYGFRPEAVYQLLNRQDLSQSIRVNAVASLLESDTSLEATEVANQVIRKIIQENLAKKNRGYLGQASTSIELIRRHASRLSPILPDLCLFIKETKSYRLVSTLSSFHTSSPELIELLCEIIDSEDDTWWNVRHLAIDSIRVMGKNGQPALDGLLKFALKKSDSTGLQAALAYLDLGGELSQLLPKYALSFPVLAKVDRDRLVKEDKFRDAFRHAVKEEGPWDLLVWLGPKGNFLIPELKIRYQQLMKTNNSTTDRLVELLPLYKEAQKEFVPICLRNLQDETQVVQCMTCLKTLTVIGDDQRLAEKTVASLKNSKSKSIRRSALACYESLYERPQD